MWVNEKRRLPLIIPHRKIVIYWYPKLSFKSPNWAKNPPEIILVAINNYDEFLKFVIKSWERVENMLFHKSIGYKIL